MAVPSMPNWELPDSIPRLAEGDVHVWRADLTAAPTAMERYGRLLSAEEDRRAARFKEAVDRQRFIASHGILREILGQYAQLDPANVVIVTDSHGKPHLVDNPARIEFSMAHSDHLALVAVAQRQAPGIDVEHVRDLPELMDIAARTLTPSEFAGLEPLAREEQVARFYRYWTGKEAVLKALGVGLTYEMRRLSAELDLAPFARIRQPDEGRIWTLIEFRPAPGFAGALAVEQPPEQLHFFDRRNPP